MVIVLGRIAAIAILLAFVLCGCGNNRLESQSTIEDVWVSSASHGGGLGLNLYSYMSTYPKWGVVTRNAMSPLTDASARRELEDLIAQTRFDFIDAYQSGHLKALNGLNTTPFHPESILAVIYEWKGDTLSTCHAYVIPAEHFFAATDAPESVARSAKNLGTYTYENLFNMEESEDVALNLLQIAILVPGRDRHGR